MRFGEDKPPEYGVQQARLGSGGHTGHAPIRQSVRSKGQPALAITVLCESNEMTKPTLGELLSLR